MRHFSSGEWADFARDAVSPARRAVMQNHLDTGCSSCLKTLGLWRKVGELMRCEGSFEPSERSVRIAKASYLLTRREHASGYATVAALVLDSALQPASAGVRAASGAGRQLLYAAGSLHIDMRLEFAKGTNRVSLLGQVLDSARPEKMAGGIPVVLLSDDATLDATVTNASGEFQLTFEARRNLRALVRIDPKNPVIIPLDDLEPSAPAV